MLTAITDTPNVTEGYTAVSVETQHGTFSLGIKPPLTTEEQARTGITLETTQDAALMQQQACDVARILSRLRGQEILLDLSALPPSNA